jgi:hypothetical protein
MKKIILTVVLFATAFVQENFAQDITKQSSLSPLLTSYYSIKDALAGNNANHAAARADEFVKTAGGMDMNSMTEAEHQAFMPLKEKLVSAAKRISETKDLARQREHFKSFSDNFYLLAKAVKLSTQPVYQQYCPMKKAYWLSNETVIKNPYFGNQMPTCGKVTATL